MTSGSEPESVAPIGAVNFGELVVTAWQLWRAHLAPLAILFGVTSAIWLVVRIGSLVIVAESDLSRPLAVGIGGVLPIVMQVALASAGMAIAALLLAQSIESQASTLRSALRAVRPLAKEVVAAALLAALVALIALVGLFGLPIFFFTIFFGPPLIAQVIALEGEPLRHATRRSREMIRGHTARVLGYLLAVAVCISPLTMLLASAINSAAGRLVDVAGFALFAVGTIIVGALANAFVAAVQTVVYFDLRARGAPPGGSGPKK